MVNKIRLIAAAAIVSMLAGSMLPAPSSAQPLSGRASVSLPAHGLVAFATQGNLEVRVPGARVEDLLQTAADPGDPRTYADALRSFVRDKHGLTLPDLRPAHSLGLVQSNEHEAPERAESDERRGTYAYPSRAGDLDGDGLEDVIVYEVILPDERIVVRALRGLDGAELWQHEYQAADAVGIPVHDLTGDGVDDVLLYTLDVQNEASTMDGSYVEFRAEFVWRLGVQSGADGTVAWEQSYAGSVFERSANTGQETTPLIWSSHRSYVLQAANIVILPFLSGDHDGDGLDDIVLDEIDMSIESEDGREDAWIAGTHKGEATVRGTTRAAVVSGRTGDASYMQAVGPGPGIAVFAPVGDIVGDSHIDLLWDTLEIGDTTFDCVVTWGGHACADGYDQDNVALQLDVLDGATFAPVWRFREDGLLDAFVLSLEEDLTGDAVVDLMIFDVRYGASDDGVQFAQALISGANGELMWRRDGAQDFWDIPLLVDVLGGDDGLDILFGKFVYEPSLSEELLPGRGRDGEMRTQLSRVEGATGKTFLETTQVVMSPSSAFPATPSASWWLTAYLGTMNDGDGDGIDDAVGGAFRDVYDQRYDGSSQHLESASTSFVEGSVSGERLYEFNRPDVSVLRGTEDLDGDALADAFVHTYALGTEETAVAAVAVGEGRELWRRDLHSLSSLTLAGDQDGVSGVEVLHTDIREPEDAPVTSLIESIAGRTGDVRWWRRY